MTASDVRQLRGEDLDRLDWAGPAERARSLGEAARLVPRVDEFDYLAACAGDRVLVIGAAGYRTPFGGASLVSLTVAPDAHDLVPDPTTVLLARLEQRAWELTCTSVDVRVDAEDVRARASLETLGYGLVGATTIAVPTVATGAATAAGTVGARERHVDGWVLRKDL